MRLKGDILQRQIPFSLGQAFVGEKRILWITGIDGFGLNLNQANAVSRFLDDIGPNE